MSALTPEQWRALDRSQRRCEYLTAEGALEATLGEPVAVSVYIANLVEHGRTLIAAARPKCERCGGNPGPHVLTGSTVPTLACPDCIDHPGWAA